VSLLLAYLGGGILAPVLHLARHRPDHTHGPNDEPVGLGEHPRELPADHAHGDDHDHADAPEAVRSKALPPVDHGHGSPSHFGLALLPAPPPIEVPLPALAGPIPPQPRERPAVLHSASFPRPRPPPSPALA
jgi:hypothetical protein